MYAILRIYHLLHTCISIYTYTNPHELRDENPSLQNSVLYLDCTDGIFFPRCGWVELGDLTILPFCQKIRIIFSEKAYTTEKHNAIRKTICQKKPFFSPRMEALNFLPSAFSFFCPKISYEILFILEHEYVTHLYLPERRHSPLQLLQFQL